MMHYNRLAVYYTFDKIHKPSFSTQFSTHLLSKSCKFKTSVDILTSLRQLLLSLSNSFSKRCRSCWPKDMTGNKVDPVKYLKFYNGQKTKYFSKPNKVFYLSWSLCHKRSESRRWRLDVKLMCNCIWNKKGVTTVFLWTLELCQVM